jgi:repressor LexA
MPKVSKAKLHETYEAIRSHVEDFGYPPSIRELGKILGLSSTDTVRERLLSLERAGMIERVEGSPRAITLKGLE